MSIHRIKIYLVTALQKSEEGGSKKNYLNDLISKIILEHKKIANLGAISLELNVFEEIVPHTVRLYAIIKQEFKCEKECSFSSFTMFSLH